MPLLSYAQTTELKTKYCVVLLVMHDLVYLGKKQNTSSKSNRFDLLLLIWLYRD